MFLLVRLIRLGIISLALFSLPGCVLDEWQIKRQIEALRQAARPQVQRTRALILAEDLLKALDRVDVGIFCRQRKSFASKTCLSAS